MVTSSFFMLIGFLALWKYRNTPAIEVAMPQILVPFSFYISGMALTLRYLVFPV
jgi:hypothetical protein